MKEYNKNIAYYHLPGLFEFYEFYLLFLELFRAHREYFYEWCDIGSIYGAPANCIWGGGRVGFGEGNVDNIVSLLEEYEIQARLTFSNSLICKEHLDDKIGNRLCKIFEKSSNGPNGIIIYSDLLLNYLIKEYPLYYYVSSTTKVITDFNLMVKELNREEFSYIVPDFRLNKSFSKLETLSMEEKSKIEFLCNECCSFGCLDRKKCYESVSHKCMGDSFPEHKCNAPDKEKGYIFSKAMSNPGFIGINDIQNIYLPMGFNNYKIEGRGLGSAILLEFLLYYMTKPEYQLKVREYLYLDSMLDLF